MRDRGYAAIQVAVKVRKVARVVRKTEFINPVAKSPELRTIL